ncbi:MAG: hypothetical protein LBV47_05135 [Bacteroidales bacterium]|nr:hypothetical protein [Bacteroidales bacterium]
MIRAKGYKKDRSWGIKVWNDGVAPARNIRFISDDIEKDNGVQLTVRQGTFPYSLLNNRDSFEMNAMLAQGHNPVPIIKFIWDDDFGENRERERVLEFD